MLIKTTLFIFCFAIGRLWSQDYIQTGTRQAAIAHAGITLVDANSYFYNPGSLAEIEKLSIALNYQNRYLLPELSHQSLAAAIPFKKGVLSSGLYHGGNKLLSNTRLGLGYALALTEKFNLGVQMNYHQIRLPSYYGSSNKMTGELGLLYKLNPNWIFGTSIFHVNPVQLTAYPNDRLQPLLGLGIQYAPSKAVKIVADINKRINAPLSCILGLEYEPLKQFVFRFGAGTAPTNLAFGFGYVRKNLSLHLASQYQAHLGFSPSFGLQYSFSE
jgi:hypothetical protein